MRRGVRVWLALWVGALVAMWGTAGNVGAHGDPAARVPSLAALQVEEPLQVDGVLDEPFWQRCEIGSGLVDQRTRQPADQQTTVRLAYTRKYLYVAVECLDDRIGELHATERREDRAFVGDDWVEVHFDPPHTHRSKYAFFANPLGTRADANEGPSGMFNYGWSADWDLAARVLADRWVFEMRIPIEAMNYERRDGQTWGFNLTRQLRRTDVLSFWSFNVTEMYKPRHFGHLRGMDLANSEFSRNWQVTPYASVQTDFSASDTDTFVQAGVDVSFRLTPAITTALTLNPDYGQVEADAATIELRDTERFLPERRPFFREGDELIRMPYRLYYSRRFTGIDAGLNASGLYHGRGFSLLNIQGDVVHDNPFYGNSTVLRVLQNVGERSSLGGYLSDSELNEGHSRVLGVDGYFFLTDAWRVSFQAAGADDQYDLSGLDADKDRLDGLGYGALIYDRYPWFFSLGYHGITREFNPLLSYIPRQNIFGPAFEAAYRPKSERSWYKEYELSYVMRYYWDDAGASSIRDHDVFARVLFRNDVGLDASVAAEYHAPYYNPRTGAGLSLFTSDYWKSIRLRYAVGEFEDIDYNEVGIVKPVKFWERLPLTYELVVRFEEQPGWVDETRWLNRLIFDLYLARNMWVKTSLQYQDHGERNVSLIYGWEFQKNRWWYFVLNSVDDGDGAVNSVFSKITYTL